MCKTYVYYVQRHFGFKAVVIFDGNSIEATKQSTKAVEQFGLHNTAIPNSCSPKQLQ